MVYMLLYNTGAEGLIMYDIPTYKKFDSMKELEEFVEGLDDSYDEDLMIMEYDDNECDYIEMEFED